MTWAVVVLKEFSFTETLQTTRWFDTEREAIMYYLSLRPDRQTTIVLANEKQYKKAVRSMKDDNISIRNAGDN